MGRTRGTTGRAALLAFLLLLAALLAGCSAKDPPVGEPDVAGDEEPEPEPTPEEGQGSGVVDAGPQHFSLTDCLDARMFFLIEPDAAAALVPAGIRPADAAGLAGFVGAPVGSPLAAGKAVGFYDFLFCGGSSVYTPRLSFSHVGILIEPPDLGNSTPEGDAVLDLYLIAAHTDNVAWAQIFRDHGFNKTDAPMAGISSLLHDTGYETQIGIGTVSTSSEMVMAEYAFPASGRDVDLLMRHWRVDGSGTYHFDIQLKELMHIGAIPFCTHEAGSVYEKVAGVLACGPEPRFAAVGLDAALVGAAHKLLGVAPT